MTFLWIDRDGYFMLLLTKYTVLYKENEICCIILPSLPSRERGLKYLSSLIHAVIKAVAPFAGAWIEILNTNVSSESTFCRSLRGSVDWNPAKYPAIKLDIPSLPSRERGLKFSFLSRLYLTPSRSLRGSVDWNQKLCTKFRIAHRSLPSRERGLK